MTKWSAVTFDESLVDSTTEIVDLQGGNSNQRIKFSIPTLGQSVIPVHKLSDLPPVVNGVRTLEQDTVYQFVEKITFSETLLIPAGWNGYLVGVHNPVTQLIYDGTGTALMTLFKSGSITSIVDAGGGAITVTTAIPHNFLDGEFVNITGTSSYNKQRLVVSNASGTVFDVQLPFASNQSGGYNTGYAAVNIMNICFQGISVSGSFVELIAADTSSVFRYNNTKASGFGTLGVIERGTIIGYDGNFNFTAGGLILLDIDKAIMTATTILTRSVTAGLRLLLLSGPSTRDIVLDKMQFDAMVASQFPVTIDSSITNADLISITNSPDNNVATDYFDTAFGALDQTNPQVFTFNNGKRPNSMTQSESRSVGVLEVDGSGGSGVAVPIEDITPAPGDFVLDSASEGFSLNTSTGLVTYNGLSQKGVLIGYSLETAQETGAAQELIFDLRINNVQQAKTIKSITTMGAGDFTPVVLVGGLFVVNPNDTFQLFKNNTTNTTNTDVQNVALLIR